MYLEKIQRAYKVFLILIIVDIVVTFIDTAYLLTAGITYVNCGEPLLFKMGETIIKMPMDKPLAPHGAIYIAEGISYLFSGIILVFTSRYLKQEQKDGTPFTEKGANMLKKLGIITIVLSAVSSVVHAAILAMYKVESDADITNMTEFAVGICFIIFSMVLRYGSQLEAKKVAAEDKSPAEDKSATDKS